MTRLAIFASGAGSNTEAIIAHFDEDESVAVSLVVTNKPEAGVIQVAEHAGVEYAIIRKADLQDEDLMNAILDEHQIDVIILAGWLLLMPEYLVRQFPHRIINIHPALLPKHGGKGMWGRHVHQAVKEAGDTKSGITIHMVNERYDEGSIIAQHSIDIQPEDSVEEIESKIRKLEIEFYPKEIKNFIDSL